MRLSGKKVTGVQRYGRIHFGRSSLRSGKMQDMLIFVGFLAVWLALQLWILPRFGIQT